MEKKIITISREFGAGGRTIGHLVADKLGIPFYDGKILQKNPASRRSSWKSIPSTPPAAAYSLTLSRPRAFPGS